MSQIVSSIKWICGSLGSWGFFGPQGLLETVDL